MVALAAAGPEAGAPAFSLFWAMVKAALALAVIVPAAYWVTRLYAEKAWSGLGTARGLGRGLVRVLDAAPLGPQRSVAVVAVAGRVLVLGSTPQGVTLLLEIDDPAEVSQILASAGEGGSAFLELLRGALARWRREDRDEPNGDG